jgi:hypothetical protein
LFAFVSSSLFLKQYYENNTMKTILVSIFLLLILSVNANGQNLFYIQTENAKKDIESMVSNFEKSHYNPYFTTTKASFNEKKEILTDCPFSYLNRNLITL